MILQKRNLTDEIVCVGGDISKDFLGGIIIHTGKQGR